MEHRRIAALVVTIVFAGCTGVAGALPPAGPTPGVVTNGTVKQILHVGSTTYLGGTFGRIGQPTPGLAALSASTGQSAAALPAVTGKVAALTADGAGGFYAGGSFSRIGGVTRRNLAHVLSDGTVDPAFAPVVSDSVTGLARADDGTLYVAGTFKRVGAAARAGLAALTPAGAVTPFDAGADSGGVVSVAVAPGVVYAVGGFAQIGGQKRAGVAALDPATGTVMPWGATLGFDDSVDGVVIDGQTAYLYGRFQTVDGQPRLGVAALDATTGDLLPWAPAAAPGEEDLGLAVGDGRVFAVGEGGVDAFDAGTGKHVWHVESDDRVVRTVAFSAGTVYFGGDFVSLSGHGRGYAGAVSSAGQLLPWDARANNTVVALLAGSGRVVTGGDFTSTQTVARAHLAAIDGAGRVTAWNPGVQPADLPRFAVETLAAGPGRIYVGGAFVKLGGAHRENLGAVSTSGTGRALAWNPRADNQVDGIAVRGATVYVGGFFRHVGHQRRVGVAAVRVRDAAVLRWNPGIDRGEDDFAGPIVAAGSTLYVAGQFRTLGGKPRASLAAITTGGRVLPWNPGADSEVDALAIRGHDAYVGGYFGHVGNARRARVAKVSLTGRGAVEPWHTRALGDDTVVAILPTADAVYIGGTADSNSDGPGGSGVHLVAASPATGGRLAWTPHPSAGVTALAEINGRLWVGGGFRTIGGLPLSGLAIFG